NALLRPFVTIEGVDELSIAVDALNNLDQAISDVLQYNTSQAVTVGPNGELIVDFSDGLGQHLETAVNDVVVQTLENLVTALNGLDLEILPGASDIPLLGQLVQQLNNLVNGVLGTATSLASEVVGVLDDLANGVLDLTTDLAHIQALGQFSVNIPSVKVSNVSTCILDEIGDHEIQVKGAIVSDNTIDLTLLGSLEAAANVNVAVEQGDNCEVDLEAPDAPVVDNVTEGDQSVTGTGEPGATVTV